MVDTVTRLSSGSDVGAVRAATGSSRAQEAALESAAGAVKGISPRMSMDPVSGVLITEYLSSDGQVEMQFPSEAAVAYLRSGLTVTGQVVHEEKMPPAGTEILA